DSCGLYPFSCQQTRPHCTLEIKYFYPVSLFSVRLENRKHCILSPETLTLVGRCRRIVNRLADDIPRYRKKLRGDSLPIMFPQTSLQV
ncbi:hypothetical protein J6590_105051, partial [Homalodisca vitripennis]